MIINQSGATIHRQTNYRAEPPSGASSRDRASQKTTDWPQGPGSAAIGLLPLREQLRLISQDWRLLQSASPEAKDHPQIVLAAIAQNGHALRHASTRLATNHEFLAVATGFLDPEVLKIKIKMDMAERSDGDRFSTPRPG